MSGECDFFQESGLSPAFSANRMEAESLIQSINQSIIHIRQVLRSINRSSIDILGVQIEKPCLKLQKLP